MIDSLFWILLVYVDFFFFTNAITALVYPPKAYAIFHILFFYLYKVIIIIKKDVNLQILLF